jgi:hypothetical protein
VTHRVLAGSSASGLDTLSIAFRRPTQEWSDLALSKPHVPTGRGGAIFRQPGPGNTKLGCFGRGLFYWEGRTDALLTGTEASWDLRRPSDVLAARDAAAAAFASLVGRPIDFAPDPKGDPTAGHLGEVRRFDLAHEFRFLDGRDGLAFLATLAGMCPPRRKIDVVKGQDGHPQTVYVRQAKSFVVTERAYDKGVESGSHAPGERIRYEAQRRPVKTDRMTAWKFATADLAPEYGRSINSYMEGSENVIAAGPDATVAHLATAAAKGDISLAKAERMIGTVALLREYGRAVYPDVQQQQRRLRGLRDVGVALDQALPADRVVPVGQLLRESVEAFRV